MSAYIVSDHHINTLVSWATGRHGNDAVRYYWGNRSRDVRHEGAKRIASVLYSQNVRSVNFLYDDKEDPNTFVFKHVPFVLDLAPVQIIKACHCLAYQSCETSDWQETEAYAILKAIESAAVHSLPGYDDADWELRQPIKQAA